MRSLVTIRLALLFLSFSTPAFPYPGPRLCPEPDTSLSTAAAPLPTYFAAHRSGLFGSHLRYRDVEFLWDSLYTFPITEDAKTTLDNFAHALVDSFGNNPFGIPLSDFNLVYDYFRRQGGRYTSDPLDTTSVLIGWADTEGGPVSAYNASDRSHVDVYVWAPARGLNQGGTYPAVFISGEEDLSTGHSTADVKHANALDIKGPQPAQMLDLDGTGWTRPNGLQSLAFNHEFQHSIPPRQLPLLYSEMFAAGAEAIGGGESIAPTDDMPYTWSLLAYQGSPSSPGCSAVTYLGSNYQGRSAFMGYLAYNFPGNASADLASIEDDLVHRWSRSGLAPDFKRTIAGLRGLLNNDSCVTCATKTYFNPGGQPMDTTSRLGLLHHNFRVATYVNNPVLDEGQYGFGYGFSPAERLGAWQSLDACGVENDLVAIPPEITLTDRFLTRDTTIAGVRSYGGSSLPLTLQPLGAEYWIVRSDPSLHNPGQDLVIRVHSDGLAKLTRTAICTQSSNALVEDGTLMASVVAYSEQDEQGGGPGLLWNHPEWAVNALPAQLTQPDSLSHDQEFVVPSFGDAVKAVLIVLTMADGPAQAFVGRESGIADHIEQGRYRVNLSVRTAPFPSTNPTPFQYSATVHEDQASWSPTSDSLVYVETPVSGGNPKLYMRAVEGGARVQIVPSAQVQSSPEWSPRGDKILFSQTRPLDAYEDLYLLDRPSGTVTLLTSGVNGVETCGTFQPNGQRIAYVLHRADSLGILQNWEIRLVDVNASSDVLLVSRGPQANICSPRWTPDGKWLYFTANDSLYAVGVQPPAFGHVVERTALIDSVATLDLFVAGQQILVEEPGFAKHKDICLQLSAEYDTVDVIVHPFRRLALRDTTRGITEPLFYLTGASFTNPRLSPDGARVAFTSDQYNTGVAKDLFVGQISWNHPPQFSPVPRDTVVTNCGTLIMQLGALDPDGETVTYSGAYVPPGAALSASGLFTWAEPRSGDHYVVFRAIDASGGVAQRVVKISVPDEVRPAGVTDLLAEFVSTTMVGLTFTSVGDDSLTGGAACKYVLKRWNEPITESNWNVAIPLPVDPPQAPLNTEAVEVTGLQPGTTYYFALKTRDEALDHISKLSNLASATTLSGGGGGFSAHRVVAASLAPTTTQATSSAVGELGSLAAGAIVAELSRSQHDLLWQVYETNDDGSSSRNESAGSPRILSQVREGDGWVTRAQFDIAPGCSLIALRGRDGSYARTVLNGSHEFLRASGEAHGGVAAEHGMKLAMAHHSRLGVVSDGETGDLGPTEISQGDTLALTYVSGDADSNPTDWFLLFRRLSTATTSTTQRSEVQDLPREFRLAQNHPNPFSSTTTIRFELPRAEHVILDLFDAQGRRVATLADATFQAGFHAVDWHRIGQRGERVRPGVFVCRIQAGSFRDHKKLVLLP